MISMNKAWAQKRAGFTIVELLIVIVVIGILAAITIVTYNGVQKRANDAAVQSDLNGLAIKFEIYNSDNGSYPVVSSDLSGVGAKASKNSYLVSPDTIYNFIPCVTAGSVDYAVAAISKSGNRFYVGSKSRGVESFSGASSWTGSTAYSIACGDILPGSGLPSGGGAPGYGSAWRAWVAG